MFRMRSEFAIHIRKEANLNGPGIKWAKTFKQGQLNIFLIVRAWYLNHDYPMIPLLTNSKPTTQSLEKFEGTSIFKK